jgi:hypothetical protein
MRCDEMQKALQVLERIVNQNREDDIYTDFRYWEDNSDKFKDAGQGSLLPLWRFTSDRTKQKHITSIAWHPTYPDLFAVAYGSYDFSRQTEGIVYCFSLKNTSYPEYMFNVECGACVWTGIHNTMRFYVLVLMMDRCQCMMYDCRVNHQYSRVLFRRGNIPTQCGKYIGKRRMCPRVSIFSLYLQMA